MTVRYHLIRDRLVPDYVCQRHGIELWSSKATLTDNAFTNMGDGWYPLYYDTPDTLIKF